MNRIFALHKVVKWVKLFEIIWYTMFTISPTDNNWFYSLKNNGLNTDVNFWTPTPWNLKRLSHEARFYFMLKEPIRKLGGFGEFKHYINLTPAEAWTTFGYRNGCSSRDEFINKIQTYINKNSQLGGTPIDVYEYKIGCIILQNCEFWEDEKFISPEDYGIKFPSQIVKYKYFKEASPFMVSNSNIYDFKFITNEPREGYQTKIYQRIGQAEFKGKILKAYQNKCCITGETCPELLEAAHIQPYVNEYSNHVQNGLLLRVDIHRLYDSHLIFIDNTYTIHISTQIKNSYYNQFNGKKLELPFFKNDYPSIIALENRSGNFRK